MKRNPGRTEAQHTCIDFLLYPDVCSLYFQGLKKNEPPPPFEGVCNLEGLER